MLESFKPRFNALLCPVAKLFMKVGIHPNALTLVGVILFAAASASIYKGQWIGALGLLVAGSLMDGFDGLLARQSGKTSLFGAILDSNCDRITEIALLWGLFGFFLNNPLYGVLGVYLCFIVVSGSLMISYVKARCEGAGIGCSRGVLQRPERLILIGIGLLCGPAVMVWILGLMAVLSLLTVIQRLLVAYVSCKKLDRSKTQPLKKQVVI